MEKTAFIIMGIAAISAVTLASFSKIAAIGIISIGTFTAAILINISGSAPLTFYSLIVIFSLSILALCQQLYYKRKKK